MGNKMLGINCLVLGSTEMNSLMDKAIREWILKDTNFEIVNVEYDGGCFRIFLKEPEEK